MKPRIASLALCLLLGACGGGTYSSPADLTPPVTPPLPPTPAPGDILVLDLTSGALVAAPDPLVLQADRIIFRKVAGTAPLSTADAVSEAGLSETTASATVAACWISTHEISQAQWGRLAAFAPTYAAPWTAFSGVASLGGTGAVSGNKPAFGISWTILQTVLTAWNAGTSREDLRVPTSAEWEFACRAGAATRYSWGVSEDPAIAGLVALTRQTRGTNVGPGVCGARTANALGFYDMSGNVWEWVGSTTLRGGSWHDNLRSAASGNILTMEPDVPYPTAGVRLVLESP